MAIYIHPQTRRVCDDCGSKVRGKAPRLCLCGCGDLTRGGRFRPGHDAKLSKLLHRLAAEPRDLAS